MYGRGGGRKKEKCNKLVRNNIMSVCVRARACVCVRVCVCMEEEEEERKKNATNW